MAVAAAVGVAVAAAVAAVSTVVVAEAVPVVVAEAALPVALSVVGRPVQEVFQLGGLLVVLPLVAPVLVADLAVLLVEVAAILVLLVVAVVPLPAVPAADPCPHPLEVIGITTVLPVRAMVLALLWSERLLSRPLPLPLAR